MTESTNDPLDTPKTTPGSAIETNGKVSEDKPKRLKFSISEILATDGTNEDSEDNGSGIDANDDNAAENIANRRLVNLYSKRNFYADLHWRVYAKIPPRRPGHPYQSRSAPRCKKPRTSFTKAQVAILEKRFGDQKYLASTERATLAQNLHMTDAQVKTWFQNRRTKWRRQTAEEREHERQAAAKYFGPGYLYGSNTALGEPAPYLRPDIQL